MAQNQQRLWSKTLKIYWQNLAGYKLRLMACFGLAGVAVIFGDIINPYLLARLIENLAGVADGTVSSAEIWNQVWLVIGSAALAALTWRIFGIVWLKVIYMLPVVNSRTVFDHMLKSSYNFFTNTFGGSLVNYFNNFKWTSNELIVIGIFELFTSILRAVIYAVILIILLPPLGVGLIVWLVLYTSSIAYLLKKKSPRTKAAVRARTKSTGAFADVITNVFTVKNFARSDYERKRFNQVILAEKDANRSSWVFGEWIRAYQAVIGLVFEVFVLVVAVNGVLNGTISVATLVLAQLFMLRVYRDVFNINKVLQDLEKKFNDAHEMVEILEQPIAVTDPDKPQKSKMTKGDIRFDSVTFVYSDGEGAVFEDFSLHIPVGQKVGLVGHSGSGKSTIVKLLMRYEDLTDGRILIDDQNIASVRQEDLRAAMATVPQEPVLFHRSIADNIRYGDTGATDDQVIAAAKKANAHDFIRSLPKGYETLVGERGIKLSGGEKERVAIARAMLSKAPILLLDEATSALDSQSENLIQIALDRLMKNRTTIVIAHRLSTIRMMDRIIVLDKGKIIEDGNHDELLELNGQYASLWSHQAGGFIAED